MSQPSGLNGVNRWEHASLSVNLYVRFLSCLLHTYTVQRRMARKITVLKTSGFLFMVSQWRCCLPRQLISQTAETLESGCELIRKMSGISGCKRQSLIRKSVRCVQVHERHIANIVAIMCRQAIISNRCLSYLYLNTSLWKSLEITIISFSSSSQDKLGTSSKAKRRRTRFFVCLEHISKSCRVLTKHIVCSKLSAF